MTARRTKPDPDMSLSPEERSRYSRHLLLPQLGEHGQVRLKEASVLVVGAGGLGSPLLLYLAAAGVGRIGIVDDDHVSVSNLHRQVLFGDSNLSQSKVEAARARLMDINPHIRIDLVQERLTSENALQVMDGYDLVADGTDNFATRYLVNDASVLLGIPNVYASIYRFDGQVSVFGLPHGPCYRCLFPEPPPPGSVPSCAEGGVLGVLPGIVGSLQAAEVIKVITGIGDPLVGRLLLFDALTMESRFLHFDPDPSCPICSENRTIHELQDYEAFCGTAPAVGQGATSAHDLGSSGSTHEYGSTQPTDQYDTSMFGPSIPEISVTELHRMREDGEDFLLLDVRQPEELTIADIGGTLLPMDEVPMRLAEVAPDKDGKVIVMCRTGVRSASVTAWMHQQGYTETYNLNGGIAAWSRTIDPSIALY